MNMSLVKSVTVSALIGLLVTAPLKAAEWGYAGKNGPNYWGGKCKSGKSQSPIDINNTDPAITHGLKMDYNVAPIAMLNNGHTLQQNYNSGSFLKIGNKSYELKQFHIHTPSEHTVMGKSFPMEIHFVHASTSGNIAVVGVLVEEGDENKAFNEIMSFLPTKKNGTRSDAGVLINARDLMPHDKSYFRYQGSLTTPPCSEGVNWYLLKGTVSFSKTQLNALHRIVKTNNRPVQKRNNRIVLDTVAN